MIEYLNNKLIDNILKGLMFIIDYSYTKKNLWKYIIFYF